jgi:hypothetical protein
MATRAMTTSTATTWVMAMAKRRVGDKESKDKGGNDNGSGNKGGG